MITLAFYRGRGWLRAVLARLLSCGSSYIPPPAPSREEFARAHRRACGVAAISTIPTVKAKPKGKSHDEL
ncbi:hypothetical protein SAMN04515647_3739 [Cohaesibacter sp. ES.047]|nr:hypothetical protein SAMN04515647_3739 [Cohaesibacter sp. ES.047]